MKLKRGFIKSTFYLLLAISHFISVHAVEEGNHDKIEQFIMSDNRLVPNIQLAQSYIDVSSIIPASIDIAPPSIDITTLSVEPKEVQPGDQVKISAKVEDDISGVKSVFVHYKTPITNKDKLIRLYDQGNNLYEGVLEVDELTENGLWEISYISLNDNQSNSVSIYNQNLGYDWDNEEDLSSGDFTVVGTNPDITPPSIDITTLSVEPKEVQPGDQVKISAKVEDDISGVKSVFVYYKTPITNKDKSIKLYDQGNNLYEGVLEVDELTENGLWEISKISLSDNQSNSVSIYNQNLGYNLENEEDLSSGDFTVSIPLDEFVDIPDNELKKQLNINLGKLETDGITLEELQSFTRLNLSSKKISNIEGLQYATNLEYLYLGYNEIIDVNPLQNLVNIKSLDLQSNKITDITPLQNLSNINTLDLDNNEIESIDSLNSMKLLNYLSIAGNKVKNLDALSELKNLEHLYANDNQIIDISGIPSSDMLDVVLLNNNLIKDITQLRNRSEIFRIRLSNNQITDFSGLTAEYIEGDNQTVSFDLLTFVKESNQIIELPPLLDKNGEELSINIEQCLIGSTCTVEENELHITNVTQDGELILNFKGPNISGTITYPINPNNPPVINAKDQTIYLGQSFEELKGVTASDIEDGNLTAQLKVIKNEVNVNVIGDYEVIYEVTDQYGITVTKAIIVHVVDTTPPNIILNGDETLTVEAGTTYEELGAKATDSVDGELEVNIDGEVNTKVLGTYIVTYTATDNSGNVSKIERKVIVVDTTAPNITLNGDEILTVEAGTTHEELGAKATDTIDGELEVTIDGEVNTKVLGTYIVTYTATDNSGNVSKIERKVTVVDTTAPNITLNGDEILTVEAGTTYEELGAKATDSVDGELEVNIDGEVNMKVLGTYIVTYTATDSSGNVSKIERKVIVVDKTPPIIDITTLSVEPKEAQLGDTVKMSIKIEDHLPVDYAAVYYQSVNGKIMVKELRHQGSNLYEAVFKVDSGLWQIYRIVLLDRKSNMRDIYNKNLGFNGENDEDLSAGDFTVATAEVLDIPDVSLKRLLSDVLYNYEECAIYKHDLALLSNLDFRKINFESDEQIKDLTGLEYATNLRTLVIDSSKIKDFTPISRLENLTELEIWNNATSSDSNEDYYQQIGSINSLERLSINKLQLENIEFVSTLSKLKILEINDVSNYSSESIEDWSPVSKLVNLEELNLSYNNINDISFVESLNGLKKLNLANNISNLQSSSESVEDWSPVSKLVNLEELNLSYNNINDISFVESLTELKKLNLVDNNISSLQPLKNLLELETLDFDYNEIVDITPLQNLVNIKALYLRSNKITDITPLKNLINLDMLYLGDNDIESIDSLSSMKLLHYLSIAGNKVKNLDALSELKNLEHLYANDNQIIDISGIPSSDMLDVVVLNNNFIKDITPLRNRPEIFRIRLSNNQITDFSGLTADYIHGDNQTISFDALTFVKESNQIIELPPLLDKNGEQLSINIEQCLTGSTCTVEENELYITNVTEDGELILTFKGPNISGTITYPINTNNPPVINAEDQTIYLGQSFEEFKNVTASDIEDGNLTAELKVIKNEVNVNVIGDYEVIYEVTDQYGVTVTKAIIVHVVKSNEVPTFSGLDEVTIEAGTLFDSLLNVGATDKEDGDLTESIRVNSEVNSLVVGTYELEYSVEDSDGNVVKEIRIVHVVDTTAPVLTLNGDSSITIELGTTYEELGAKATDVIDGELEVTIDGEVNTKVLGTYIVTYTATDSSGNVSKTERKVTVVDTTTPVITLNGDSSITVELGTTYEELGAKATDSVDGELVVTIDGEVNTKVLGTYIVTYTATDSSGNVSKIERKVIIVYAKEDLNEDGIINELDLDLLSSMYGLTTSDADFKEKYDFNQDGIIDLYDLVLISSKIQS